MSSTSSERRTNPRCVGCPKMSYGFGIAAAGGGHDRWSMENRVSPRAEKNVVS